MYSPPIIGVTFLIIIIVARYKVEPRKVVMLSFTLFITMAVLSVATIYINTFGIRGDVMTGHITLELLMDAWDYYWQPIFFDCLILISIYLFGVLRYGDTNEH
jgi:hypothetical protein